METQESRYYALPGLTLRVMGPSSPVSDAIEKMLCQCRTASRQSDVEIWAYISDEYSELYMPEWLTPYFPIPPNFPPPYFIRNKNGEMAVIDSVGPDTFSCAVVNAEFTTIQFFNKTIRNSYIPLCVQSVLSPLLREFFTERGKMLLHGAGLCNSEGKAIVFLGDSGAGKTTTALSLMRLGLRLIADDLITVTIDPELMNLEGITEPLNLTTKTIAWFDELKDLLQDMLLLKNGKRLFYPETVFGPACYARTAKPIAFCVLNLSSDGPDLEPLKVPETMGYLIKANTFAFGQDIRQSSAYLWDLLDRGKFYRLRTGSDPIYLGAWLRDEFAL